MLLEVVINAALARLILGAIRATRNAPGRVNRGVNRERYRRYAGAMRTDRTDIMNIDKRIDTKRSRSRVARISVGIGFRRARTAARATHWRFRRKTRCRSRRLRLTRPVSAASAL